MQEIVEYHGHNCYIRTSVMCFIKCIKNFTETDYTEEFLTFIRNEKNGSGVMLSARIQRLCRRHNIDIGCFGGTRINPRNITERNKALFLQNNLLCLIWKSIDISFSKAKKELKNNFNVVDFVISQVYVKVF